MNNIIGAVVIFFMISCKSQFPLETNYKTRDKSHDTFLKPKVGDTIVTATIETKNERKLFKPTLYIVNGKEFKTKEIDSYQDGTGWYHNIGGSMMKPIAGPRILVFKSESLVTSYSPNSVGGGGRYTTQKSIQYYMKKAGQDKYEFVGLNSAKKLAAWVEDNEDAFTAATKSAKYARNIKIHKYASWAGIVGGLVLASNLSKSQSSGVAGVATVGMFFGGFINLGINLVRRGKVGRNYADAINIYNDTPEPKKK